MGETVLRELWENLGYTFFMGECHVFVEKNDISIHINSDGYLKTVECIYSDRIIMEEHELINHTYRLVNFKQSEQ